MSSTAWWSPSSSQLFGRSNGEEIFPTTMAMAKMLTKPSFKPTDEERELVQRMSAVGITQESIARVLRDGIDVKTLRKHFRNELDTALIHANAAVSGALYTKALTGDTQSIIWWEKTRQGRKATNVTEVIANKPVVLFAQPPKQI
jgi:hypothetical protein